MQEQNIKCVFPQEDIQRLADFFLHLLKIFQRVKNTGQEVVPDQTDGNVKQ